MRGKRKKEGVGVAAELRHHCVTKELLETLGRLCQRRTSYGMSSALLYYTANMKISSLTDGKKKV